MRAAVTVVEVRGRTTGEPGATNAQGEATLVSRVLRGSSYLDVWCPLSASGGVFVVSWVIASSQTFDGCATFPPER